MIVDAILDFLHALAVGLFSWLHDHFPAPPDFWADASEAFGTLMGEVSAPVRYFIPIEELVTLGIAITGLLISLGLVRLARRVVSLFTGGGGMA